MKIAAACTLALGLLLLGRPAMAQGGDAAPPQGNAAPPAPSFSQAQLEQMVAPIALYPDALVSQILIAATYPIQVVEAYQWLSSNKKASSAQMQQAAKAKGWDPSVQSLLSFPQIVERMYQNVEWTQQLGEAFLAQQSEVMSTIQAMRQKAYAAGNLKSTPKQTVTVQPEAHHHHRAGTAASGVRAELQSDGRLRIAWAPATWYYPPAVYAPPPGYVAGGRRPRVRRGRCRGRGVGLVTGCAWSTGNVYVNNNYYAHGGPYHGGSGSISGANGGVAHYGNTHGRVQRNTGHVESYNSRHRRDAQRQVYAWCTRHRGPG